jgi:hypothetical protein
LPASWSPSAVPPLGLELWFGGAVAGAASAWRTLGTGPSDPFAGADEARDGPGAAPLPLLVELDVDPQEPAPASSHIPAAARPPSAGDHPTAPALTSDNALAVISHGEAALTCESDRSPASPPQDNQCGAHVRDPRQRLVMLR